MNTAECRDGGRGAGFTAVIIDEGRNATVHPARQIRRHSAPRDLGAREARWASHWTRWAARRVPR